MTPRFSVVIPVRDRADVIGRATAGVLAQTFGDLEVVVVDDGSVDDSVAAARAVSDGRVRIVRQERAGTAAALTSGVGRATGDWCVFLEPDDEVAPGWLARLGRLIDSTGAGLVSCGGEQRHLDGSTTSVAPMCFRPGAFAVPRQLLVDLGAFGGPDDERTTTEVGTALVAALRAEGRDVVSTPEPLVCWNERVEDEAPVDGDQLRLHWALQAIDAVARTPIPDAELLVRYATIGGVAAARLRDHAEARRLLLLARKVDPRTPKHWARWLVACVPPVSDRVWEPEAPQADGLQQAVATTAPEDEGEPTTEHLDTADEPIALHG